jgi:hypothetical protein
VEGQARVVEAEQVQDGGVQVVDVDDVVDRVVAVLIGRAVDDAALDALAARREQLEEVSFSRSRRSISGKASRPQISTPARAIGSRILPVPHPISITGPPHSSARSR